MKEIHLCGLKVHVYVCVCTCRREAKNKPCWAFQTILEGKQDKGGCWVKISSQVIFRFEGMNNSVF